MDMTDAEISERVKTLFDMRPHAIEHRLKLRALYIRRRHRTDTWAVSPGL